MTAEERARIAARLAPVIGEEAASSVMAEFDRAADVAAAVEALRADVERRFDHVDQRFEQIDQRFEQVDRRFEQVDQRFEQVDRRFEQVDRRFERVEERLTRLELGFVELNARFDRADDRFTVIDQRFEDVRDWIEASKLEVLAAVRGELVGAVAQQTRTMAFTLVGALAGLTGLAYMLSQVS